VTFGFSASTPDLKDYVGAVGDDRWFVFVGSLESGSQ
jgi:hypothetical protein